MWMIARFAQSLIVAVLCSAAPSQATDEPPAFPREGARLILENERLVAYDVTWAPNEPTLLHRHVHDYFGVELVAATFQVTAAFKSPRAVSVAEGDSWFFPAGVVHVEEGLSRNPSRHAIVVELKNAPTPTKDAAVESGPERQLKVLENDRVIMWNCIWESGQRDADWLGRRDAIVMFVNGGILQINAPSETRQEKAFKPGDVLFVPAGDPRVVTARSSGIKATVVELK